MYGVFVPPRTPAEIKAKLQATLKKVAAENKALQKYVQTQDIQLTYLDGPALGKWLEDHNAGVVRIMKKEGLYMSRKKKKEK
jgi:tripartite-type tricarboxylate transporter receptor subunit TctC